jgi:hypothetical protein
MKRTAEIIIILPMLPLILVLCACLSFKLDPLPDPGRVVREVTLCKEIDESQELLEPGESVKEFMAGSDPVICFVSMKDVTRRIRLRWRWYDPRGFLHKASQEVTVNPDEVYLEAVTAYDRIEPEALTGLQGKWIVTIFVNDILIGRMAFSVRPSL